MWRACLVLVAACGTSSAPTPAPARTGSAAPHVAWQECTEAARARMETALVAREGLERLDARGDGSPGAGAQGGAEMPALTCVTMQLGHEPGFFVELVGRRSGKPVRLHGVLALDGTTELIPIAPAASRGVQIPRAMVYFETIDLDGDGTDDLIAHRRDPRLPRAEWIDVIAVRGRTLVDIEGPPVAHEDPDVDEACTGTLSETRAGSATHLVVAVSASTGESEHCLATGRHELALAGDRLVEVATR